MSSMSLPRYLGLSLTTLALAALTGCISCNTRMPYQPMPGRIEVGISKAGAFALRRASDCDQLEEQLRAREAVILARSLEANREWALEIVRDPDSHCTDPVSMSIPFWYYGAPQEDMAAAEGGASEYTTTNNQVAGVDEADLIKNDGQHIYMVAGGELLILEAWPADDTRVIARTSVDGQPRRLLVTGDRAVVFSAIGDPNGCLDPNGAGWTSYYYYGHPEQHGWSGFKLQMRVFDIHDRTSPRLERVVDVSGELLAARLIDDTVHSVVSFPDAANSGLLVWPAGLPVNPCDQPVSVEEIEDAFDALAREHDVELPRTTIVDYLPGMRDRDFVDGEEVGSQEQLLTQCEGFFAPEDGGTSGYVSVLSFPAADDATLSATTVLGNSGQVYASADSVYIATMGFENIDEYGWGSGELTAIHKFSLGQHGAPSTYRGSGQVQGRLINTFAMDEHQGALRVATTVGFMESNNLFVLQESLEDEGLEVVGQITGLAANEDIRAVRFDGDRGFVVTFKKTDPLFTFDLSDPYQPRVLGELKIPGYSTYMHFMDANHLLTIGFDADDQGSFAWFQGVMLQIFDVTEMEAPTLMHKEIIGTRGSQSDATANHLAFNYFAARGLLALPMAICEGTEGGGSYGTEMSFSGLLVYRVSVEDGFARIGGVDHGAGETDCNTWWTDPNTAVKRSIFMEDYVYSLSSGKLKVNHIADLGRELVGLSLPEINEEEPVPYCFNGYYYD